MLKKIKRPLSILLSVLLVVSLFAVVPVTASAAAEPNFVKAAQASELTANNMGSCTYDEAKAWAEANLDALRAERDAAGGDTWVWIVYGNPTESQALVFAIDDHGNLTANPGVVDELENIAVYMTGDDDIVYYVKKAEEPADPAADVKDLIDALPAEITLDNAADVQAARQAYDALSDTDKQKIDADTLTKLTDAETKIADLTAAKAVTDAIKALPAAEAITIDDSKAVTDAKAAYDALTADQKKLVATADVVKLNSAVAKIADLTAAKAVTDSIEALPATDALTINDAQAVANARAAYDVLTPAQKALVDSDTLTALTDAEAKIEDLTAAKMITDQINALPSVDAITLNDELDVVSARQAYDALTPAQKALVDAAALTKLTDAETKIADLTAAQPVIDDINALPAAADVALSDKQTITDVRAAYNALTDDQKALIDAAALTKLTDAETKIADLEAAKAVTDAINALPENVTPEADKTNVQAARAAYNALTDAQKELVDADALTKLANAEKSIADQEAAATVAAQINALPATVTPEADKTNVQAARAAYDALTDDQKACIDDTTLAKLTAAEKSIDDQEKAAAAEELLNAIPETVNPVEDKAQVETARAAYDALTDDQKALVDKDALAKLTAAEKSIKDQEEVISVVEMIANLPAASDVTVDDKEDVEAAKAAYDALTDDQKALVPTRSKTKIAAAVVQLDKVLKAAADQAAADDVSAKINAIPGVNDITPDDKAAIDEATAAYDALTDEQKALVPLADRLKLAAAQGAVAAAIDIAAAQTVSEMINALPAAADITAADREAIDAADAAYNELTNAQKALVPLADRLKLTVAKGAVDAAEKAAADEAAADEVEKLIEALPAAADITLNDKEAVEAARAAYDALTNDQKRLVVLTDRAKLVADEAAIEKLENDAAAAAAVTEQINSLPAPEDIAVSDLGDILNARRVYNQLTDDQKALVDDATVQKLADAEKAYADEVPAATVEGLLDLLPAAEDIKPADKDYTEAVRTAYDLLTDDQKARVDADLLKKLTDAEEAISKFVLLGDANSDGVVDVRDITAIQRFLADALELDEAQQRAADVNADGKVTIDDATAIQSCLAEYAVEYPIGQVV